KQLPFALTGAQQRAIGEISADLDDDIPMNRILVGDVGSGKTVVAAAAIYQAYLGQATSLYMAPTEILAHQHFQTLRQYLEPLGLKITLVTGNCQLASGNSSNLFIGTHALLYHLDQLKNIGLVVIDEQHRFGVEQRALLTQPNHTTKLRPHLLTMTATPIPRSLALALYGDLDLSYLDEMPPGRKPVKTWVVPPAKREAAYRWIEKQILTEKSQTFLVCPFIEESETLQSVKAVNAEYGKLQKEIFPKLKIGLLHGKLKAKEKEATIEEFRRGGSHILLATPVVEVGVDIPNATIMVIEGAERFGLASLHQLRGRVGRGSKASYCLLFSESPSQAVYHRLKAMETIHDGLKLSELDLKNRGQGEIYGLVQHGLDKLKIASVDDVALLQTTKLAAEELLHNFAHQPPFSSKLQTIKSALVNPN
ncbi:MAG: ATP-dependent DNA helicase RecG, partial [bacterium]|nr:ATP-dependent DNA helicase RecG [bacterium]